MRDIIVLHCIHIYEIIKNKEKVFSKGEITKPENVVNTILFFILSQITFVLK